MRETRVYVSVLIKNIKNEYLIIRRSEKARFAPGQWEFVNGGINEEETAEDTAIREVREETGLIIDKAQLVALPVHELADDDGRWVVIPYTIVAQAQGVTLSDEHTEYRWVKERELIETPNVGEDFGVLKRLMQEA